MKRRTYRKFWAGLLILNFVAGGAFAADRTHEIGVQAYAYAYPMILMEVTRRWSSPFYGD